MFSFCGCGARPWQYHKRLSCATTTARRQPRLNCSKWKIWSGGAFRSIDLFIALATSTCGGFGRFATRSQASMAQWPSLQCALLLLPGRFSQLHALLVHGAHVRRLVGRHTLARLGHVQRAERDVDDLLVLLKPQTHSPLVHLSTRTQGKYGQRMKGERTARVPYTISTKPRSSTLLTTRHTQLVHSQLLLLYPTRTSCRASTARRPSWGPAT